MKVLEYGNTVEKKHRCAVCRTLFLWKKNDIKVDCANKDYDYNYITCPVCEASIEVLLITDRGISLSWVTPDCPFCTGYDCVAGRCKVPTDLLPDNCRNKSMATTTTKAGFLRETH